jgi:hypothetical protein
LLNGLHIILVRKSIQDNYVSVEMKKDMSAEISGDNLVAVVMQLAERACFSGSLTSKLMLCAPLENFTG